MYRDASTEELYTDNTLETAFTAVVDGELNPVQVKAISTNTITIGGNTFIKLTAGDLNVVDKNGKQLICDSTDLTIYYINDGVPESSSMSITDE